MNLSFRGYETGTHFPASLHERSKADGGGIFRAQGFSVFIMNFPTCPSVTDAVLWHKGEPEGSQL